jgi:GNAT superfamily N-acetyltransferase
VVTLGRETDYKRAKALLNRGRHPTFIGPELVERQAKQGGLLFAQVDGKDAAVAVINIHLGSLSVLCVLPEHRNCGLGTAFLRYLSPNFARVTESAVPWFERNGYEKLGEMKQGRTLKTQIMVRRELLGLAGRVRRVFSAGCPCAQSGCAASNSHRSAVGTASLVLAAVRPESESHRHAHRAQ